MSERFKIVSVQTYENILFRGFPIIPEKSRITYDNQTKKIVVQFKLVNVCSDIVDTVYIKADFCDVAKEVIATVDEHIISMVNAGYGVSFGDKSPLYMEDTRISGVELTISKVVFQSGKVWKNENNSTGETAEPAKPLNILKDNNLKEQLKNETRKLRIQTKYQFEDFGSYWRCSCGMLNTGDVCCKCKATTENLRLVFSEEYLTKRFSEDNAKQQKHDYSRAVGLQKSRFVEDLKEAVRIFESLSTYEDSAERIKQCGQRISEIEAEEAEKEAQREKERQEQSELLAAKAAKKKKITVGIISGVTAVAVATVVFIVVRNNVIIPNNEYNNAMSLYESGNYEKAEYAFQKLGNYKDSADMLNMSQRAIIEKLPTDTISASVGGSHTVCLKSDGTVMVVGHNKYGQCDVSDWTDIVAVSAGNNHTVGLKSDGTVVAVGDSKYSQCNVSKWKDIVAVSAGSSIFSYTVGLKSDGTAVAVGCNDYGQCADVYDWTDIVAISAGYAHTVGLKSDGTVMAAGNNEKDQCNVSKWTDIVAVSAGNFHTVGLKSDGTVVAVGDNEYGRCNVSDWTVIVAVSAECFHTVGLKSDGTVVAVGYNGYGQCDISDWTDIVAVSAESDCTVGLKSDGTVVAAGIISDND